MRREKFMPKGGPDGGNGGNGGNIVIIAKSRHASLKHFKYKRKFFAQDGKKGGRSDKHGKNGSDLQIEVPLGTEIYDYESRNLLYSLTKENQEVILAYGGNGGRGNSSFKTSVNKAPKICTPGKQVNEAKLFLQLKLFCDCGIIGLPNCGKSTLLNTITNTKSIVADYEFTTIKPVIGALKWKYENFIIADIPGLIKGASENIGLGHKFLKHIERSKFLIHMIDVASKNLAKNYLIIRDELEKYNKNLIQKQEIIVFSKADLLTKKELLKKKAEIGKYFGDKSYVIISSNSLLNVNLLKMAIAKNLMNIE